MFDLNFGDTTAERLAVGKRIGKLFGAKILFHNHRAQSFSEKELDEILEASGSQLGIDRGALLNNIHPYADRGDYESCYFFVTDSRGEDRRYSLLRTDISKMW